MKKFYPVCVVILAQLAMGSRYHEAEAATTVCPVNAQQFISTNRDLLPLLNVKASSEDELFNPVGNFITPSSPPWCTASGAGTTEGHYIELNFTQPVVIVFMESSGFINGYVDNFTIQYTMSPVLEDFNSYGILEELQTFLVGNIIIGAEFISLEKPIVARRVRFGINGGILDPANRLCWEIRLHGCTLNESQLIEEEPTTVTTQQVTSTTGSPYPTTNCSDGINSGLSRDDILMIVLPTAMGVIIIVILLVIIGVAVCTCSAAKRQEIKEPEYDTVTVRMLNSRTRQIVGGGDATPNSMASFHYDSPRPVSYDVPRLSVRSRGGSMSMSTDVLLSPMSVEIKNPIYAVKRSSPPDNPLQLAMMGLTNLETYDNDYEMIPDGVTTAENQLYKLHRCNSQPVQQRNGETSATNPLSYTSVPSERGHTEFSGSNGSVHSSVNAKTHEYATVKKPGSSGVRRASEPLRETPGTFETLHESRDHQEDLV